MPRLHAAFGICWAWQAKGVKARTTVQNRRRRCEITFSPHWRQRYAALPPSASPPRVSRDSIRLFVSVFYGRKTLHRSIAQPEPGRACPSPAGRSQPIDLVIASFSFADEPVVSHLRDSDLGSARSASVNEACKRAGHEHGSRQRAKRQGICWRESVLAVS